MRARLRHVIHAMSVFYRARAIFIDGAQMIDTTSHLYELDTQHMLHHRGSSFEVKAEGGFSAAPLEVYHAIAVSAVQSGFSGGDILQPPIAWLHAPGPHHCDLNDHKTDHEPDDAR